VTPSLTAPAPAPALADPLDELFDMVNLPRKDTGVDGTIHVSTAQGQHGPQVKWFPGRPAREAACLTLTLEPEPRVINHGLPDQVAAAASPRIRSWASANREALLRFWNEGLSWTRDEVSDFIDGLNKLP